VSIAGYDSSMQLAPRRTERLWLREIAADDAGALLAIQTAPEVSAYMTYDPRTLASVTAYLEACVADSRVEPRRVFELAIVRAADDRFIGRTGCMVDELGHEARFWYELDPGCWKQGYAVEATRSLLGLIFDDLGVHRAVTDIDPRNQASARVSERLGMRREAHFLENQLIRGEWCDTWLYGMLRREWQALPAG
jgi:RimJ/RimL family protein N-acetyltransferase